MTFKHIKEKPYGYHWTFKNCVYSVLPSKSRIFPIFTRKGFSEDSEEFCDFESSKMMWYIHMNNMFEPSDYKIDSVHIHWNGKMLSQLHKINRMATTYLPKPVDNALIGRTYSKFMFFISDLKPYTIF